MVEGPVYISNLNEFLVDLKQAPDRFAREMRGVFRSAASGIVSLAASYAPRRTGQLAQRTSVRVNRWNVKITWLQSYAGVQEFGRDYSRTRGGITSQVHMTTPTPRFAYKAWEEEKEGFGEKVLDALAEGIAKGGFWELR